MKKEVKFARYRVSVTVGEHYYGQWDVVHVCNAWDKDHALLNTLDRIRTERDYEDAFYYKVKSIKVLEEFSESVDDDFEMSPDRFKFGYGVGEYSCLEPKRVVTFTEHSDHYTPHKEEK